MSTEQIARLGSVQRTRPAAALSVCLLALALGGCQKPDAAKTGTDSLHGVAAGCNVLLITMDTTRADRLGCYGYDAATTPVLDALAADGMRFDQAYSPVPITLPSHSSIMTGVYPPEHGVHDNGRFVLGTELPTLAEIFRQHDFATAAFIAARVLDGRYGLARGFATYDDEISDPAHFQIQSHRRADAVCDNALTWLNDHRDGPFFCWVHLFDPHAPFDPPPAFARHSHPYDGEIAFMDAQIGRLVEWLDQIGLRENTLIIAVADHGESLGDHGYDWHALLVYDSIIRVPLIVSLPERLPAGRVSAQLVCITDLMPTIMELFGWTTPASVSGRSFVPALTGHEMTARALYAESEFPYYNFGWSKLRAITTSEWKYIQAPTPELYDRRQDPAELNNLAAQHPELVNELDLALEELVADFQQRTAATAPQDSATLRALRGLGYVGGAPPDSASSTDLRSPREMLPTLNAFRQAESLFEARRLPDAISLLEPAVAASPESFVIVDLLGKAYLTSGQLNEARHTLEGALALSPESATTRVALAQTLVALGRHDPAIAECQRAIELDPGLTSAHGVLGDANRAAGRIDEAIAAYANAVDRAPDVATWQLSLAELLAERGDRSALAHYQALSDAAPHDPAALTRLGAVQLSFGERALAEASLTRALDRSGSYAPAYELLAQLYQTQQRYDQAITVLKRGLSTVPDYPSLANNLAWILATVPETSLRDGVEAVRLAKMACAATNYAEANFLDTLAAAYAEAGRFTDALATADKALELARNSGQTDTEQAILAHRALYEQERALSAP